MNQGAGDRDPLHFAAAEFVGQRVLAVLEFDRGEQLADAAGAFVVGDTEQLQGELDVFVGGEGGKQMKKLENGAHPVPPQLGELIGRALGQVIAVQHDPAVIRRVDPGEAIQQGALAGTGRAHDRNPLPAAYLEREIVQDRSLAVRFAQVGDLEDDGFRFHEQSDADARQCSKFVGPIQPRRPPAAGALARGRPGASCVSKATKFLRARSRLPKG